MDSRDIPPPPPQPQPPSHLQPPPLMNHHLHHHYRNPNPVMGPFGSHHPQPLHHQQQQMDSLRFGDGSASNQPMRLGVEQVKKKRGRPRKYTPDGNTALGLAPSSPLLSNSYAGNEVGESNSADPPAKRNRGRPPGSSKKQLDALGGTAGIGFTPHVIEVKQGEDIASKVMAFSDQGPRTICILSASGAVSCVTLRQASHASGICTFEGRFEIITLSGTFLNYEVNGSTNRSGSLSVALAGSEGKVLGGNVVGSLIAATQVQVIVGSFVAEAKKPKQNSVTDTYVPKPEPASAPANMLNFGSNSQGPSSESSEENESGSPSMHHDNNNSNGIYGNSLAQQQQQQQQLRQMQMFQPWHNHQ